MSLGVYLYGETIKVKCTCSHCDHEHEIDSRECFFDANITHNLGKMAAEAGIYKHMWRPEELGLTKAHELIVPIEAGLLAMKANPEFYKEHDDENGWGTYDQFVPWIERYLNACKENPDATIEVSR